jgi:hypothetical protein
MTASVLANNSLQRITGAGTYTVGSDCSIKLTFTSGSPAGGTTDLTSFLAPLAFRGLLVDPNGGVLSLQPTSSSVLTGQFAAQ